MIPPTHGGITPSPHSGSPSHTPWYTPQSSPDLQARLQLNPGLSTVSYHRSIELMIEKGINLMT